MKIERATEIADWIILYQPDWKVTTEAGYSGQAYLSIEVPDVEHVHFVLRTSKTNTLVASGVYENLSKYIRDGDKMPRLEIDATRDPSSIAIDAIVFATDVYHFSNMLVKRMEEAKENNASRVETAKALKRPGVKITSDVDIWWETKRWQISGEILNNGGVSLNIICDAETAKAIFDALRKE